MIVDHIVLKASLSAAALLAVSVEIVDTAIKIWQDAGLSSDMTASLEQVEFALWTCRARTWGTFRLQSFGSMRTPTASVGSSIRRRGTTKNCLRISKGSRSTIPREVGKSGKWEMSMDSQSVLSISS